ncbi:MAG: protein kinase [Polyangiaceae bacterium]
MENRAVAMPKVCPSCGTGFSSDVLFCPTDGSPLRSGARGEVAAEDPYVGKEILGHIEIRKLAGVGAMGRVYRAFQKGIDRDVAVKVLHRELSANPQLVVRFNREAKVASRLQHPNVVQVYLAGQLPDGALYIAMEYLDGLSLQGALGAANGAMSLPRALHLTLQICDAVGEAHAQGVVHRDLKPENVMLVRRGEEPDFVKVLDFGIARFNWGEQSMATAAGLIFGTARYISPEGAQGDVVGPAGDVYAIATLLYQMLAGRTPFEGEQAVGLLVQQIHDAPPPLRSIPRAAYVPAPLADVVMQNLSKKPADRHPDARAFGRALIDAARAGGVDTDDILARGFVRRSSRDVAHVSFEPMQKTAQHAPFTPNAEAPANDGPRTEIAEPAAPAFETPSPGVTAKMHPTPLAPHVTAPLVPVPPPSSPGVDTTLDDHDGVSHATALETALRVQRDSGDRVTEPSARRLERGWLGSRGRAATIVVACFFVGVAGATAVAYRAGYLRTLVSSTTMPQPRPGPDVAPPTELRPIGRPNDPIVVPVTHPTSSPNALLPVPSNPSGKPSTTSTAKPAVAASKFKAAVDVSPAHPLAGQPVALVAKVSGLTTTSVVDSPAFELTGPGLEGGAKLGGFAGPTGTYRSAITLFEPGSFKLVFTATVDGAALRSEKVVTVAPSSGPAPTAAPSATGLPPPPPLPSGSARWL